jgi:hypothetical protein
MTDTTGTPRKFKLGDRVFKVRGSQWQGRVVGFYSTKNNPLGYCIESEREIGSVQVFPESALEYVEPAAPQAPRCTGEQK